MIGKQEKGRSFRGCLKYVLEKPGSELIGGNMLGETVGELAAEFGVARRLNPNLDVVVYHAMLSVSAQERRISSQWLEIAEKYLEGMGFSGCQFVAVRHTDEEHDHIHIVACRIRLPDAKTISDSNDYRRSEDLIRELERIYGLESVTPSYEQLSRSPTTGEVRRFEKQQQQFDQGMRTAPPDPPFRMVLQTMITHLSQCQPSVPALIQQLQERGVEINVKLTEKQEWGISYGLNGEHYSGTQLGRAYTFKGLQNHLGVSYDCERDDEGIRAILGRDDRTEAQSGTTLSANPRFKSASSSTPAGKQALTAASDRLARSTSDLANGMDEAESALADAGTTDAAECSLEPDWLSDRSHRNQTPGTRSQPFSATAATPTISPNLHLLTIQLEQLCAAVERLRKRRQRFAATIGNYLEQRLVLPSSRDIGTEVEQANQCLEHLPILVTCSNQLAAGEHYHGAMRRRTQSPELPPVANDSLQRSPEQSTTATNATNAGMMRSQPERSIEEKQRDYEQLWHQSNAALAPNLSFFDRDVQIAQSIIAASDSAEAQRVLCRSPHTQALLQTGDPDSWRKYVVQVTCVAQERLLSATQRQQGRWAAVVLTRFLNYHQTDDLEGKHYRVQLDPAEQSLTLTAKDGRGVLLKQQQGSVVQVALKERDRTVLQALQRQLSSPTIKQTHRQSQSSPDLEID